MAWTTAVLLALATSIAAATTASPGLHLTTENGARIRWWTESTAPARWSAPGLLARAARWREAQRGVQWCEIDVSGVGEAAAIRLIAVRLDPRQVQLGLRWGMDAMTGRPAWDLTDAPSDAALAVNAGMFIDALPWGWVVNNGIEQLPPGRGPLSSAVVITLSGEVAMVDGDDVSPWRASGNVAEAFQTYPTLLVGDGDVPLALQAGDAIDRTHRDARLAVGVDRDGRLLLVMTRLDLPALERLPLGLTVPEMAAVMGSLGARQAALLDGGVSAQLRLRDASGAVHDWKGMRQVPLALVATPR